MHRSINFAKNDDLNKNNNANYIIAQKNERKSSINLIPPIYYFNKILFNIPKILNFLDNIHYLSLAIGIPNLESIATVNNDEKIQIKSKKKKSDLSLNKDGRLMQNS